MIEQPKAWLLFWYRVGKNGWPVILGAGIYSEPTPTCLPGHGYLEHSDAPGRDFQDARDSILRRLASPQYAWIRAMLVRSKG